MTTAAGAATGRNGAHQNQVSVHTVGALSLATMGWLFLESSGYYPSGTDVKCTREKMKVMVLVVGTGQSCKQSPAGRNALLS